MTRIDPAVAWLEQQAARYAAGLGDPVLEMQTPTAPAYLAVREGLPEDTELTIWASGEAAGRG